MYTSNSSHLHSLFTGTLSPEGSLLGTRGQTSLSPHQLRNAVRSASVTGEPQQESSVSHTIWKYKPLPVRRKSKASRSPSCCSTTSEAESITESIGSGKFERQNNFVRPDLIRNRVRGSSVYERPTQRVAENTSAQLSAKISEFLQRTDHVIDEWKRLGHKEPLDISSSRMRKSTSMSNILIKGLRYYGRDSSRSVCSTSCDILSETDEVHLR